MIQLTEKQKEIIDSSARVKLVMGGARSGKTIMALLNMFETMNNADTSDTISLFLIKNEIFARVTVRKIKRLIKDYILNIKVRDKFTLIETTYGDIYVSTEYIDGPYRIITVDNATSNKYVKYVLENQASKIALFGHCPEDGGNTFFKAWLNVCINDIPDTKAFKLQTWDNPTMKDERQKWESDLIPIIGQQNYERQYLCKINL